MKRTASPETEPAGAPVNSPLRAVEWLEVVLDRNFVVAGFAAGRAIPKTVFAQADVQLALAKDTVLLALASFFDLLTLAAANSHLGGSHGGTLSPLRKTGNVPLVTRGRLWAQALDSSQPSKPAALGKTNEQFQNQSAPVR